MAHRSKGMEEAGERKFHSPAHAGQGKQIRGQQAAL
jgi:hypothetical protein